MRTPSGFAELMLKACLVALAASADAACTGANRGNTFSDFAATVNWVPSPARE
jgi:hypothetical protein